LNLPVIQIPLERPFDAELIWTEEGRREQRRIFEISSETAKPNIFEADRRPDFIQRPISSASLTSIIMTTTNILFQEVHGWKAILQTKEIEPA
jgi:hypothetical protein